MFAAAPDTPGRAPLDGGPLAREGGGLVMRGTSLGRNSDVALRYVLGCRHVEQYVGPLDRADRLQALPLAWDISRGEWFDLFAGETRQPEDWGHWTNRGMAASPQCLFCHTTGYDKGYHAATDGYASRWVEMGVGCEACHGPGAAHVHARTTGDGADPYREPTPAALLGSCGACHARRVERAPFVPGHEFLDAYEPELLDTQAYHPDGQVKEELYELVSFQMSRMYAEGVRCWDCHEVHGGGTIRKGDALCLGCHAPEYAGPAHVRHAPESAGARCTGCHMPITVYMQRDPRHDHSFARPDPEATIALGIPNACNACHTDRDAEWAAARVREWYPDGAERARRRAVAGTIARARAGDPESVTGLLALLASDADDVRRASAARLLARFPTAAGVTGALATALGDRAPLVRAGAAWAFSERAGLVPDAQDALVRALRDPVRIVRLHAALALRTVDPDTLRPDARATLATATAEWRESQMFVGDTPEAHYNLALYHAARGEVPAAEASYREALRLWPTSVQARHNLGMLFAEAGRLDQAQAEFETILARVTVPETAFALGLLHGERGNWREAAAALERCLQVAPQYPRARYNLGLAQARAGDTTKALATLELAAADPATHAEAVRTIVDLARATKDQDRLERWIVEAARLDPSVAEDPALRHLLGER
jgi:Tfp pilus assembly protein PilF